MRKPVQRTLQRPLRALLCAGIALALWAAADPGPLWEGRWLLVERTAGEGGRDLGAGERATWLEIAREGGRLTGRRWQDGGAAAAHAPPTGVGPLELTEGSGELHARRVVPASGEEGLPLEVVEVYRLDGDVLMGTVTVRRAGAGGALVHHLRFERRP